MILVVAGDPHQQGAVTGVAKGQQLAVGRGVMIGKLADTAMEGGMGQGDGSKDDKYKGPSNSSLKNSMSRGSRKKTLAEELDEERQKKALEWEMFKKYEIRKQIVQSFLKTKSHLHP